MSLIEQEQEKITLDPKPGFVVKTKILESKIINRVFTKVFINICHDQQVPQPPREFIPEIVFPLIIENQWEIPIIVSREKETKDKKGFPSLVYDCCINSKCFQWCQISKDLRLILIEWCIESIELLHEATLEREYTIPKMLSKGDLSHTVIGKNELEDSLQKKFQQLKQNETLGLIEEMKIEDEDDTELPDIMNINNTPKKNLIQEIEPSTTASTSIAPPQKIQTVETPLINYDIKFVKIESDTYKLAVIFKSPQITNSTDIDLQYTSSTLTLINKLPGYTFTNSTSCDKNTLVIPLSRDIKFNKRNLKSFFVDDNSLYIFL
ncbi:Protein interacting with Hsp90 1 [Spathaspora sp. JA1]|nr:Protein interacting with Hsp90 1 [Spathaspora sp. JA1]